MYLNKGTSILGGRKSLGLTLTWDVFKSRYFYEYKAPEKFNFNMRCI